MPHTYTRGIQDRLGEEGELTRAEEREGGSARLARA
eukprot:COSAG05_NODE_18300_length_310_cov_0.985782_1_plen_35_part_10